MITIQVKSSKDTATEIKGTKKREKKTSRLRNRIERRNRGGKGEYNHVLCYTDYS